MSETHFRNTFLPNAPRFFQRQAVSNTGQGMAIGGMSVAAAGIILAPFTGGATVPLALAGWGTAMGGVGAVAAGELAPTDTGVEPEDLAEHITNYLPDNRHARYCYYDDFWECAKKIRNDLRRGDPVIVFWSYSPTSAHYVNVVGVSVDSNDLPEEFVIMETDGSLRRLSYQDMRFLMKRQFRSYTAFGILEPYNYHIIRFYR